MQYRISNASSSSATPYINATYNFFWKIETKRKKLKNLTMVGPIYKKIIPQLLIKITIPSSNLTKLIPGRQRGFTARKNKKVKIL